MHTFCSVHSIVIYFSFKAHLDFLAFGLFVKGWEWWPRGGSVHEVVVHIIVEYIFVTFLLNTYFLFVDFVIGTLV